MTPFANYLHILQLMQGQQIKMLQVLRLLITKKTGVDSTHQSLIKSKGIYHCEAMYRRSAERVYWVLFAL